MRLPSNNILCSAPFIQDSMQGPTSDIPQSMIQSASM